MGFTHSAAILFLLTERAEQCYKKEKNLKVVGFPPLKAHKHTVQPLGTFLKLSFDMIEFSYA